MKKAAIILFSSLATLVACSNNHAEDNINNSDLDSSGYLNRIEDNDSLNTTANIDNEMNAYRLKINARLNELKTEIDEAREKRKAEKNLEKQKVYDQEIEKRERSRITLQEKLDKLGNNASAKWNDFKKDVDDFFEQDKTDHSTTPAHR